MESVQKAACLQKYNRELWTYQESPVIMPVDPDTHFIRELLESLKPTGIQLQGKIQVMSQGERIQAGLVTLSSQCLVRKGGTSGEVELELISYG